MCVTYALLPPPRSVVETGLACPRFVADDSDTMRCEAFCDQANTHTYTCAHTYTPIHTLTQGVSISTSMSVRGTGDSDAMA